MSAFPPGSQTIGPTTTFDSKVGQAATSGPAVGVESGNAVIGFEYRWAGVASVPQHLRATGA